MSRAIKSPVIMYPGGLGPILSSALLIAFVTADVWALLELKGEGDVLAESTI